MFKRVPGTRDILPGEISWWLKIEEASRRIFSLYNYQEIRPPLIEDARLFNRSLGESAEIVQKQMFLVRNNEDIYALRPEGTASIVRAYLENNLDKTNSFVKLYYTGAMFRMERPQKGRLRQFHHLGSEVIGSYQPQVDAEVISLGNRILTEGGINGYKIKINTLGCRQDKKELSSNLNKSLKDKLGQLCKECQVRFERNILRVLDCKNESCREVVSSLNLSGSHICKECADHFKQVREALDSLKINYQVSPYLVRGLDYYTRTVFEFIHPNLGPQQDALGAGGRYDNLVKDLGGPEIGAVGFAFGMERLLIADSPQPTVNSNKLVYIITMGDAAKKQGVRFLDQLRRAGIAADTDYEGRTLKGAMRQANDLKAGFVLIIGDNELNKDAVTLKNMSSGEQKEVKSADIIEELKC
ncbi:MAG: histidine--tRNA ligase [Candidatus Omnitrophota bacterium]|nr:histidine--tRNA ligase [Candidatus Omnitrophota bacterium]MBU1929090.1 histidine--tRNA ligase [Candidatus Omnitrophota bacterium]MBU1929159.1 histidine--tRNA ligase [Candidatus Omnitrophota bacterium]MBU2035039.1 histidine--tRNA ligase [Candidatus Omnitrophota bacterium]